MVNLLDEPDYPQLSASSAFIKREAVGNLRFNTNLVNSEDALFINKILIDNPKLGLVKMPITYIENTLISHLQLTIPKKERIFYRQVKILL